MTDKKLAPVCGLYCGSCEHLGKDCQGCGHEEGKPFWTIYAKIEACPLYTCCVNEKHLEHCGLCKELPCETFREFYDPSLSREEAEKAVLCRIDELKKRRKTGTGKWLEDVATRHSRKDGNP